MRTTMVAILGLLVVALTIAGWAWTGDRQNKTEKAAAGQICVLKVDGMTCGGCAAAVKSAAKTVAGVNDAKVSLEKGTAEITYDPAKTNPEAIAKAITDHSGFRAEAPQKNKK